MLELEQTHVLPISSAIMLENWQWFQQTPILTHCVKIYTC